MSAEPIEINLTFAKNQQARKAVGATIELQPGTLYVLRRDDKASNHDPVTEYDQEKIYIALTKAMIAVEGPEASGSTRVHEVANNIAGQITERLMLNIHHTNLIPIEDIQDHVELALMRAGEQKIARAYVLYREERRKARELANTKASSHPQLHIKQTDGRLVPLNMKLLEKRMATACINLEHVEANAIIQDAIRNIFDGISASDLSKALIMSARTMIEKEPNYTYVTSRLLLDTLRGEALALVNLGHDATFEEMAKLYPTYFKAFIHKGIELEMLDTRLASDFDLDKLGAALLPLRDLQFTYLSLQTL